MSIPNIEKHRLKNHFINFVLNPLSIDRRITYNNPNSYNYLLRRIDAEDYNSFFSRGNTLVTNIKDTQFLPLCLVKNLYSKLNSAKDQHLIHNFCRDTLIALTRDISGGSYSINYSSTFAKEFREGRNNDSRIRSRHLKYANFATILSSSYKRGKVTNLDGLDSFLDSVFDDSNMLIDRLYTQTIKLHSDYYTILGILKFTSSYAYLDTTQFLLNFNGIDYLFAQGLIVDLSNNKVIASITLDTDYLDYYLLATQTTAIENIQDNLNPKIFRVFVDNDELSPSTRTVTATMWSIILNTFIKFADEGGIPIETLNGKDLYKQFYSEEISLKSATNITEQINEYETLQDEYLEQMFSEDESIIITP